MAVSFKHFLLAYFLVFYCILNPQDSTKQNALGGRFMSHGRIFGPGETEHELRRGQYPFVVMVQIISTETKKERICSGSLVTADAVITSSLCLNKDDAIAFWAGNCRYIYKEDFDPPTQGRELLHFSYFWEWFDDSTMAFALTTKKFNMTSYVQPIGLFLDEIHLHETWHDDCYVVGFGVSSPVVDDSRILRYMVQRLWSRVGCTQMAAPSAYMCAPHDVYNKTTCGGDTGGPVLCNIKPGVLKQFGIVHGRTGVESRMMDLDCLVPQLENRYLFVGYFHAFLKTIPNLTLDGPTYGPIKASRRMMGKMSAAGRLAVAVQILCASITSFSLVVMIT